MDPAIVDRLFEGTALADLSSWRKAVVTGAEARPWLAGLISADLSNLSSGRAVRSLLLTPTGRVRAEFTVVPRKDGLLLVQDPSQPEIVLDLLRPYVLSSDVDLQDRSHELAVFAFPGRMRAPEVSGAWQSAPSCLGIGIDVIVNAAARENSLGLLQQGCAVADDDDVEAWRIAAGIPRLGVDVFADDLPQEGGLTDEVAFDKGCYLGQEAVAKVQNLGHPRRLLMPLEAQGHVVAGDRIALDGMLEESGEVTSAVTLGGRTVLLARVAWEAREAELRTSRGVALSRRRR